MNIKINGKKEDIIAGSTVSTILQLKNVRPEMVAVELNGELLSKEEFGRKLLNGDTLEFLYYMAGGRSRL